MCWGPGTVICGPVPTPRLPRPRWPGADLPNVAAGLPVASYPASPAPGDPDDCGHEREGGKFDEENTCAAGGGGQRLLLPLDPHPDPDDEEGPRRRAGRRKGHVGADAGAYGRGESVPSRSVQQPKAVPNREDAEREHPPPTVTSPRPFEPGKPIGERIAAYRKARPELLDRLLSTMSPFTEELQVAKDDRQKVLGDLDKHRAKIMYMENWIYAQNQGGIGPSRGRAEQSIGGARCC